MNRKDRRAAKSQGSSSKTGQSSTNQQLFIEAFKYHNAGHLIEAEQLYRKLLSSEPFHADALSLLGSIVNQNGNHIEAVELIKRALKIKEDVPFFHNNLGLALQAQGESDQAKNHYKRSILLKPDFAEAYYNLGIICYQQSDIKNAVLYYQKAISFKPDFSQAEFNLATIYGEQKKYKKAASHYLQAITLRPDFAEAYNNLGTIFTEIENFDDAAIAYKSALAIKPNFAEAHNNLGQALKEKKFYEDAAKSFMQALLIDPNYNAPYGGLQEAIYRLEMAGNSVRAIEIANQWLKNQPDNSIARHTLVSLKGDNKPSKATDDYVETLYDSFAKNFDSVLNKLEYQGPSLIKDLIDRHVSSCELNILDAGCGTGLAGAGLRAHAKVLTGIDLSQEMLKLADAKKVYDHLHHAELVSFMELHSSEYDLITIIDVLIYCGDLNNLMAKAKSSLHSSGWLAFTVEELSSKSSQDWNLLVSGRYNHSESYVKNILDKYGFKIIELSRNVLRQENGIDVNSLIVLAKL